MIELIRSLRRARCRAPAPTVDAVVVAQPAPAPAPPEWEMVPDSDEVWTRHDGWSHDSIVKTQSGKWAQFLRSVDGPGPLGQSHEANPDAPPDFATHNTIMSFGYALGRATAGHARLSVLDWGGGLGHYYVYATRLFPDVPFDFTIKDLAGLCATGAKLLPGATFEPDEAKALSRKYDLVFASSSLHYTRDRYGLLGRLCDSANEWLMITRTPVVEQHDEFVVVQRPHAYGYMTEYPGWFMNKKRLSDFMNDKNFSLERQFLVAERPVVPNAPEQAQYYGFLFRRNLEAGGRAP